MRRKSLVKARREHTYKAEVTRLMQAGVPYDDARDQARALVKIKFTKTDRRKR